MYTYIYIYQYIHYISIYNVISISNVKRSSDSNVPREVSDALVCGCQEAKDVLIRRTIDHVSIFADIPAWTSRHSV